MIRAFLVAALPAPTFAYAHSWYPYECCSGKDCKPVACDEIEELKDGTFRYDGVTFAKSSERPSQDSKCHVCIQDYSLGGKAMRSGRCIFMLQGM